MESLRFFLLLLFKKYFVFIFERFFAEYNILEYSFIIIVEYFKDVIPLFSIFCCLSASVCILPTSQQN